jgi:putative FmdB family regulatory protein
MRKNLYYVGTLAKLVSCKMRRLLVPIYEYSCNNCQHTCEQLESVSALKIQTCPSCNKETLVRQVSNTSFQLKGSGWYVTDFRGDKKKSDNSDNK